MRGIGRVLRTNDFSFSSVVVWSAPFSSGTGRGRGSIPPRSSGSNNAIGKPPAKPGEHQQQEDDDEEEPSRSQLPAGRGHGGALPRQQASKVSAPVSQGRGRGFVDPLQTPGDGSSSASEGTAYNPFQAWQAEISPASVAGRGRGGTKLPSAEQMESKASQERPSGAPTKAIFLKRSEKPVMPGSEEAAEALPSVPRFSGSPGYGRGMPVSPRPTQTGANLTEENRHARPVRRVIDGQQARPSPAPASATPRLVGEDAVKKAMEILSKRAEETGFAGGPGGRGGTGRDRGRGRGAMQGRGRGRGRGWGRGRGRGDAEKISAVDDTGDLFLGDDADGERLVKRIGEEKWNQICDAINTVSGDIVPDPAEDIYEDALHTNMLLEFEPEYAMESFGKNPDIDEKPPISLREFLVKMKPFLVAAEGIESEQEWKEHLEETMDRAPHLRHLLHYYSGHGRMTARQEQKELESIASRLPDNAHPSVKNFTDRALLSLQSNPGWGFDKKYQCINQIVGDVTRYYQEKQK